MERSLYLLLKDAPKELPTYMLIMELQDVEGVKDIRDFHYYLRVEFYTQDQFEKARETNPVVLSNGQSYEINLVDDNEVKSFLEEFAIRDENLFLNMEFCSDSSDSD